MSYLQVVANIRAAAVAVNPNGTFGHGLLVDMTQSFDSKMPMIWLLPFDVTVPIAETMDRYAIRIGFWTQDRPDTSILEREQRIGAMDVMCRAFMAQLYGMSNAATIQDVTMAPEYKISQAHLDGYSVSFTYLFPGLCLD